MTTQTESCQNAEKEALEKGEMRTWCTSDMTKIGGWNNPDFKSTG